MHVREATPADAAGVRRVADAAWRDAHEPIVGAAAVQEFLAEYYAVETLRERYRDGDNTTLVACEDDTGEATDVVGYASGVPGDDDAGALTLGSIYVHPDRQGEGVGSQLLDGIEALARDGGYDAIRLVVMAANENARGFYEARGFEHVADDYDERLHVENCEYVKVLGDDD
ncbi:GNAT family N-acetyltransferase [Halobacterium rubrum]|uniref:GNAT family N-acetyltransferase n=1 Tax=Halobacterium TaxID=2239 RepID=UPI001F264706|nr:MULTISPECIES: GNAT family N-acetyltransferase [Halobacterium]MDH5019109.1 GNAT family N-acetyltransferase [Halobacterium rubrum]